MGTKKNTDTVPAMLTPGEFVIKRDSAQKIGYDALELMNETGKVPDMKKHGGQMAGYLKSKFLNGMIQGYQEGGEVDKFPESEAAGRMFHFADLYGMAEGESEEGQARSIMNKLNALTNYTPHGSYSEAGFANKYGIDPSTMSIDTLAYAPSGTSGLTKLQLSGIDPKTGEEKIVDHFQNQIKGSTDFAMDKSKAMRELGVDHFTQLDMEMGAIEGLKRANEKSGIADYMLKNFFGYQEGGKVHQGGRPINVLDIVERTGPNVFTPGEFTGATDSMMINGLIDYIMSDDYDSEKGLRMGPKEKVDTLSTFGSKSAAADAAVSAGQGAKQKAMVNATMQQKMFENKLMGVGAEAMKGLMKPKP